MLTGTEGQLREFVKWVGVIDTLKTTADNYDSLLNKLKSKDALAEAIPFIEVARIYLEKGFQVSFLKEIQDQKNPDLELYHAKTGEHIYIEVSRVSEGKVYKEQELLYHRLLHLFQQSGFNVLSAGKMHKLITDDQLPEFIQRFRLLMQTAADQKTMLFHEDEFLVIAFAHPAALGQLDQWCAQRKLRRQFDGFNVDFDYTSGMISRSRIDKEAKQLPLNAPGLIYFPVHILYMLSMNITDTARKFAAQLVGYANVMGVVFYGELMPPMEETFSINEDLFNYSMRSDSANISRYTLVVKNPKFDIPISPGVRASLLMI